MNSTTFGFSKFVSWWGILFFTGILAFCLYIGISFLDELTQWLYLGIPLTLVSVTLYIFARWNFIPMLQGCITLELDEEKAQFYLEGIVIYWKDVVEISEDYSLYYSGIKFQMINERNNRSVSTKWIECSTKSICNTMQEYFAQTL